MGYLLGVDFGTSFTAAVAFSGGSSRVVTLGKRAGAVPTASFVREDGSLIHGEDAYLVGAHDPDRLIRNLKRRLADPAPILVAGRSYTAVELTSAYLRWVVDAAAVSEGAPADRLLFTHPANWRSVRLDQYRAVLEGAGLPDVLFAPEPFAAAAFHAVGGRLGTGDLVGVYDLGGGTFDAAVLRRRQQGFELAGEPEGIEHLGGVDFDDILFHLVRARVGEAWNEAERRGGPSYAVAVAGIRREAVAAKEALSVDTQVEVPVMLPGVNQVVKVTRVDFERLIAPSVQDSIGAFRRSLRQSGATPADLSAVLLVGGSVALGAVRNAVRQVVGDLTPILDADPKYAVARGAALLAAEGIDVSANAAAPPRPAPTAGVPPVAASTAPTMLAGPSASASPPTPIVAAPPAGVPSSSAPPPPVRPAAPPPGVSPAAPPPVPSGSNAAANPGPSRSAAPGAAGSAGPAPALAGASFAPVPPVPPAGPRPSPASASGHEPAGPKRTKLPLVLAAIAVVALVAAGAVWAVTRGDDGSDIAIDASGGSASAGTKPGGATTDSTTSETGPVGPASADRTSAIPAGTFTVGLEPQGAESAKARAVTIEPFSIDTFEVTNREYDAFVQTVGAPPATSWPRGQMPDEEAEHPVQGVEFEWAGAFCAALSKRLPTEAEWEVAARGPDASLYPWGSDRAAVDIDTAGSRPVGSTGGNVSPFGVHDTVASVWEWVDEPYDPVPEGQRVRHGGENGRIRDGAAMRQVVDPANRSVVAETGFRCAADTVDAGVQPLQFDTSLELPDKTPAPTTTAPINAGAGTVLVEDDFEQRTSGFLEDSGESYAFGYYAPSWYHLEATGSNVQTVSTGGYSYADASIETHAHVDGTISAGGRVRYGLVVRAGGDLREPPASGGPSRPTTFTAFTIDPRGGVWELSQEDAGQPLRTVQSGPLPAGVRGFDGAQPDALRVDMRGPELVLFVNDVEVGRVQAAAANRNTDIGFFVENRDETFADVHFADLKVVQL